MEIGKAQFSGLTTEGVVVGNLGLLMCAHPELNHDGMAPPSPEGNGWGHNIMSQRRAV